MNQPIVKCKSRLVSSNSKILLTNRAFLEATAEAIRQISGLPAMPTTHFHRSLDGARAINVGLWTSQEEYAKMNANPPMAEPLKQMRALANNEFQMSLYEIAHTEIAN